MKGFIKHPKLGVGEVLFAKEGFPSVKALFASGEHKVKKGDLSQDALPTAGEPIDSFKGETKWLSNFEPSEVTLEGVVYPTTEHAFQAAKTSSVEEREVVRTCSTPGKARRAGKKVTLRSDWEKVKVGLMAELNFQKFSKSEELREKLLATGKRPLIEGNSWNDKFWGVCKGEGQNWLGRVLMLIREELRP